MRFIFSLLFLLTLTLNVSSQITAVSPTYVYKGFIETETGKRLYINLNFVILLDSTLVGSYNYKPKNGTLNIVGHLKKDNSYNFVERDSAQKITGFFHGTLTSKKDSSFGKWTSPSKDKTFDYHLNKVLGRSIGDILEYNRSLYEYKDLNKSIKDKEKVLSIDVAFSDLKKLPNSIEKLPNIVSINLSVNSFTKFPKELSKLTTLDEISLSSNELKSVGPEIGNLKNLKILILNFNQLESLPKEIGKLTNLLYLEIGNNKLTTLPIEIKNLTKLQELHINENKLSNKEKKRIQKLLPNCVIYF